MTLVNAGLDRWRSQVKLECVGRRRVRTLILILAVAMALEQIAVAQTVVLTAFAIAFGAVMTGLAIAFGIGGAGLARRFLEQQFPERPPADPNRVSHL